MIEVRIGVIDAKEISVDLEEDADEFQKRLDSVIADGSGVLWITDKKGKRVGVPAKRIGYVELDPTATRKVGFAP